MEEKQQRKKSKKKEKRILKSSNPLHLIFFSVDFDYLLKKLQIFHDQTFQFLWEEVKISSKIRFPQPVIDCIHILPLENFLKVFQQICSISDDRHLISFQLFFC